MSDYETLTIVGHDARGRGHQRCNGGKRSWLDRKKKKYTLERKVVTSVRRNQGS